MRTAVSHTKWQEFVYACERCQECKLAKGRQNVVIWRGAHSAKVLILGDYPNSVEDELGLPFLGPEGEMLDLALQAFDLDVADLHFANQIKCLARGPEDADLEVARNCRKWLNAQFKLVQAPVILLLGELAYRYFTGDSASDFNLIKGKWIHKEPYFILPTVHPRELDNIQAKEELWLAVESLKDKVLDLGLGL